MLAPNAERCRLCSKLTAAQAQARHGVEGTGCWDDNRCHQRRSYYRNRDRYNKQRRTKYRGAEGDEMTVKVVPIQAVSAAVLHLYRSRIGDPLHAVGAELWVGEKKVAVVEPVHTLGMTGSQVKGYLRQVLHAFSQQQRVVLEKFETQVELDPGICPITPCPLRPY